MSNAASPPAAAPKTGGAPPKYKRKLSNYLLDAKLQLRYVLFVTVLSAVIAGALGYMIYSQRHSASASIEHDLGMEFHTEMQDISQKLDADDRWLIYKMVGVGVGLVIILSAYLTIMTHKVAGPLYKVSMYFDRMADGKLGRVTPLRQGDMLQDFYQAFSDAHAGLRTRATADADKLAELVVKLKEPGGGDEGDYRGEAKSQLTAALDDLGKHVEQRKKQLA
nr:hypothetical protein [Kofleriaceae bacterium]